MPKLNTDLSDESKSFQERIDDVRSLVEENLHYTKALSQTGLDPDSGEQQELKQLLRENLKTSQELKGMMRKIHRWIALRRVWTVVKILIILIPLILGLIYLPPLIQQSLGPYQQLLQISNPNASNQNNLINQFNQLLYGNQAATTATSTRQSNSIN